MAEIWVIDGVRYRPEDAKRLGFEKPAKKDKRDTADEVVERPELAPSADADAETTPSADADGADNNTDQEGDDDAAGSSEGSGAPSRSARERSTRRARAQAS